MRLSAKLKQAVREWPGTQVELSRATGVSVWSLCRFGKGTTGLPLDSLDKLAEFLNLELRECQPNADKLSALGCNRVQSSAIECIQRKGEPRFSLENQDCRPLTRRSAPLGV
mgnify:CR=1 FL=1